MKVKFEGTYSYQRDIGRVRLTNEDQVKVMVNSRGNVLLVVADGMGGHNKGDFAAQTLISSLEEEFYKKPFFASVFTLKIWLVKTLKKINETIYTAQENNKFYSGLGTTVAVAVIFNDKLVIAHAGDSRVYMLNHQLLMRLTEDHSYVDYLYKSGQIKKEEMEVHPKRHVITNAMGLFPSLSVDIRVVPYNGETILLCSDGLYNNVSNKDIESILNTTELAETKVLSLINLANFNGGSDNISLALWETIKND
ncbi:MAG TPA: Stp1/IreP family PP2C-type Ser/Thr phosphatase [Candidatus Onthovivens sp.]|nr:Stp1/IreP family PP2C-type Ser/Thr phosphatase [Candidatus Onthovivens sp.]